MNNIITDDIGVVVASMRDPDPESENHDKPYYMYGHRLEISNRLVEKERDMVYKYQKYPLIALRLDIPETRENRIISCSLNLAILAPTQREWNAEERYENNFKPVLIPLYEKFMTKLAISPLFMWKGNREMPKHTKVDRPFHGTTGPEGNVKYIFGDNLDCIEILNLELKQRIKTC